MGDWVKKCYVLSLCDFLGFNVPSVNFAGALLKNGVEWKDMELLVSALSHK